MAVAVGVGLAYDFRDQISQQVNLQIMNRQQIANGDACAGALEGYIPDMVRGVKAQIADPDSFRHVKTTRVGRFAGKFLVAMRFAARNSNGGMAFFQAMGDLHPQDCSVAIIGIQPTTEDAT